MLFKFDVITTAYPQVGSVTLVCHGKTGLFIGILLQLPVYEKGNATIWTQQKFQEQSHTNLTSYIMNYKNVKHVFSLKVKFHSIMVGTC